MLNPFSWPMSISWRPYSSGWWLWNIMLSSGPVTLRSGWLPRLYHIPAPCTRPVPAFHEPPQFGCRAYQGLSPIPDLMLPHPLQIPIRRLQDPTRKPLIFWCMSATPVHLELPGVPPILRGYLAQLSFQIIVFPVYPRKGPWVHVGPGSVPISGGQLYGKRSAYHILSLYYIQKYPHYQGIIISLTKCIYKNATPPSCN